MESLVIAIISLLLVLPVIYFLPLGFTRKGKLLILICAFIVFIIGIAGRTVMSVWQVGLVLILLAIWFSYFIGKKFGTQLFLHVENNPGVEDKVIKFEIEDEVEEEILSQIKPKKDNPQAAEKVLASSPTQEVDEEIVEGMETTEIQSEDEFVLENVYVENEEPENTYEIHINDETPVTDFDDLLKEIEMELNDNNNEIQVNDEVAEVPEETAEIQPIELDEIEDEVLNIAQPALEEVQFDSLQVISDEQPNEDSGLEEIPIIETVDHELEEIMVVSTDEDDIILNPFENEQQIEEELPDSLEGINELEEIESIEVEIPENEVENETESDDLSSEELDAIDGETDIQDVQDNHNLLSQQLFATMISQIRLSRNKLSNAQYEKMIVDHLHPGISDHDYYTFVSLLIDHYIETKQYSELTSLISQNKTRFEKYPVILQEINFLLEEYCKI
ncbi:hypothetical protein V7147_04990 [Bacillus sp. JJ1521]|uniref:hypothetical protein n=1 Tax=Bacillus sp. JJ1521 TaxID=3122957 RepID=UPI002FFF8E21